MHRKLILFALIIALGDASGAVVVTHLGKRVSELPGFPAIPGLDVDSDGVIDFHFDSGTDVDTAVGATGGVTELKLWPNSSEPAPSFAYMGSRVSLLPGNFLELSLPVINADGSRGLWLGGASISSRLYDNSPPLYEVYNHLGGSSADAYLGFRIQPNAWTNYLGYIQFQFTDWTNNPRFTRDFAGDPLVVGWALQTESGQAIQVMPIPEPSTGGLILILLAPALISRNGLAKEGRS